MEGSSAKRRENRRIMVIIIIRSYDALIYLHATAVPDLACRPWR